MMKELQLNASGRIQDDEVIGRVIRGEKGLFEILMRRYNQPLYRVVRSYLSHEEDVEDIMQETYLKAFEKLQQYRGGSSFSTWLIRIGINESLMRLRNKKKHERSLNSLNNSPGRSVIQMHPERTLINNEMRILLEKAIDDLPEKYRIVYVMKEIEDMDFDEIASCLNITSNNVKVRLHRAKGMLKEALFLKSSQADVFTFGNHRCDKIVEKVMSMI